MAGSLPCWTSFVALLFFMPIFLLPTGRNMRVHAGSPSEAPCFLHLLPWSSILNVLHFPAGVCADPFHEVTKKKGGKLREGREYSGSERRVGGCSHCKARSRGSAVQESAVKDLPAFLFAAISLCSCHRLLASRASASLLLLNCVVSCHLLGPCLGWCRSKRTLAGVSEVCQGSRAGKARWEGVPWTTTGALVAHREVGPAVPCFTLSMSSRQMIPTALHSSYVLPFCALGMCELAADASCCYAAS